MIRGSILDFKWAFKKLPKSIPEALKKVAIITVISKEYFGVAQDRLRD
jgi:hypothetical protein